jgi:hypothetical protein
MEWIPDGHIVGHDYLCATIHGGRGNSFKVQMAGVGKWSGSWRDWADPSAPSGSDLISLYAAVKSITYKEATHELAHRFGVKKPKREKKVDIDWEPIRPVPDGAYELDSAGSPALPPVEWPNGAPVAFWAYLDGEGRLLQFRCRFKPPGPKSLPLCYCRNKVNGETTWTTAKDLPRARPLYNLLGLACQPDKILIVEGEKAADSAASRLPNWCVITWPGGAENVQHADWAPVIQSTARKVLWPDKDDPGRRAMTEVAGLIGPCQVIRHKTEWPDKHDVADLDWDGPTLETWIESAVENVKVAPVKLAERPLVQFSGNDRLVHIQAIFYAIKEAKANLFYTANGLCEVQTDVYGRAVLNYLDATGFRDWCSVNLDTRKHITNELRWSSVPLELASAAVFTSQEYVRPLWYVSHTPTLSPSGRMIQTSGYDEETKIYIILPNDYQPCSSRSQAIEIVKDILADFPHETPADLCHAVSFPMTCIMRHYVASPTPLYRFESPTPGTGKTLEGRTLFEIITPNTEYLPAVEDNEEAKKTITAALLRMPAVIAFDNVSKFEAIAAMQALTTTWWTTRLLGQNKMVSLPIWCAWAITVNNPELSHEMLRRSVRVRLNAHVEHPERRPASSFRHPDIVGYVRKFRSQVLAAWTNLCELEGDYKPNGKQPYLGSYGPWCEALYPRLESAGFHDFLETYDEDLQKASAGSDQAIADFVRLWAEQHGTMECTAETLLSLAESIEGLPVKRSKEGFISKNSLGWLIKKIRDRVYGSYCVEPMEHGRYGNTYSLSEVNVKT